MSILSEQSLVEAPCFFPTQKCLNISKAYHFLITSELVYTFYFITLQLHLIFNQKGVSCLINHLIYQMWLWIICGFPKIKFTIKAERFVLWNCIRKWLQLWGIQRVPDIFWYWKKFKPHYFAVQSHTFLYLLLYCFRDKTQISIKYSKWLTKELHLI